MESFTPLADGRPPPMARGKLVVTGCCGRLGRTVASHLATMGEVHGIDRSPRPEGLSDAVVHHQLELSDTAGLATIMAGASFVVHLAACPDDAPFERVLLPTNVVGSMNVLNACRDARVERVVVASSGKVHAGHAGSLPVRLSDMPTPVCNYGATKLLVEGAAQAFAVATGTPTIAIRFAWCPRLPSDVAAMKAATAFGMGANEFVSPADAARCVAAALMCSKQQLEGASHPPNGSVPYAAFFCQSNPVDANAARFDMVPTAELLGFTPADVFDEATHAQLCASDCGLAGLERNQTRSAARPAHHHHHHQTQPVRWWWVAGWWQPRLSHVTTLLGLTPSAFASTISFASADVRRYGQPGCFQTVLAVTREVAGLQISPADFPRPDPDIT